MWAASSEAADASSLRCLPKTSDASSMIRNCLTLRLRRAASVRSSSSRTMSRKDSSFFYAHMPFLSSSGFYNNRLSQESLFQFQSDAIRKAAQESSCVFVGRCADYVLREYENTVNIFITADIKERIERVAKRHGCGAETAMKIINDRESERSTYYNYYTGKKWGYSASYDLCVNSSILGMEKTEELIKDFIRKKFGM